MARPPLPAVRRRRIGPAVWDPTRVGRPGYPRTPEAYAYKIACGKRNVAILNARPDRPTRKGIPNGWGGDRELLANAQLDAAERSKEFVKMAVENGVLPNEDPRVKRAFEVAMECLDENNEKGLPVYTMKDRLAAGRFLADFLKSRPASKVEATVNRPEDFLQFLVSGTPKAE